MRRILRWAAPWLVLTVGFSVFLFSTPQRRAVAQSGTSPCAQVLCAISKHYLSAANNNSTLVKGAATAVYQVIAVNTTATLYYLKLYDKVTAPTCGTDTPVATYPLPASATGAALVIPRSVGLGFNSGFGFCLVGGLADNDNTNAATGIAINFDFR